MKVFSRHIEWSLRIKLTFLIEIIVVIVVLGTGIIATMQAKETLLGELHKRGLALGSDLAKFMERPLLNQDLSALRRFVNHSMEQDYVRHAIVLDPLGKVIMHSDLAEVGKTYRDSLSILAVNSKEPGHIDAHLREGEEPIADIFVPIEVSDVRLGTLRLGYSCSAVEKEMAEAEQHIFLIGIGTVLIGGIVAYLLATFISSPIIRITDAIQTVANGDLNTPVSINRHDEIGTLADSFNRMAQDLGRHRKRLEALVDGRTAELETANEQLQQEITERKRSEDELKRSREQLRELASHLQSVREEERGRIAREIHDELGQALTALKMDIHWVGQRLSNDQELLLGKIQSISRLIDMTAQSVQRISSELRPGLLDDLGLSAAVEWQADEFQDRTNIQCEVASDPEDITLNPALSTAVFRIFQEALTNIARHANATGVKVILKEKIGKVELTVRDNGKGITDKQVSDARSFGLIGMRERVHYFGGDLTISGTPNKGTTVSVSVPHHRKVNDDDTDNYSR
jgi:signal transduction histidine kinase